MTVLAWSEPLIDSRDTLGRAQRDIVLDVGVSAAEAVMVEGRVIARPGGVRVRFESV